MKNNIISLIISLILILAGIAMVPMASVNQNFIFAVMVLIILGLFGIIRFIANITATR